MRPRSAASASAGSIRRSTSTAPATRRRRACGCAASTRRRCSSAPSTAALAWWRARPPETAPASRCRSTMVPAALLLVPPAAAAGARRAGRSVARRGPARTPARALTLPATWGCELVPTLENDWGDLARPAAPGAPPVERWALRWRVERDGEDGLRDGWAEPDARRRRAGLRLGGRPRDLRPGRDLVRPGSSRVAARSLARRPHARRRRRPRARRRPSRRPRARRRPSRHRRGRCAAVARGGLVALARDPQGPAAPARHARAEGARAGGVPRLRGGPRRRGGPRAGAGHARLDSDGVLAIGAAAAKRLWLDGAELTLDDAGHLAFATFAIGTGCHLIDLRLTAEDDLDHLRAHLAIVRARGGRPLPAPRVDRRRPRARRATSAPAASAPAAVSASAAPASAVAPAPFASAAAASSEVALDLPLRAKPQRAVVQVAAYAPCALRVNGTAVGRQGGFDPYAEQDVPRVRRYDVTEALRAGDNELAIELPAPAPGEPLPAVLVDARIDDRVVCSGAGWRARVGAAPAAVETRRPAGRRSRLAPPHPPLAPASRRRLARPATPTTAASCRCRSAVPSGGARRPEATLREERAIASSGCASRSRRARAAIDVRADGRGDAVRRRRRAGRPAARPGAARAARRAADRDAGGLRGRRRARRADPLRGRPPARSRSATGSRSACRSTAAASATARPSTSTTSRRPRSPTPLVPTLRPLMLRGPAVVPLTPRAPVLRPPTPRPPRRSTSATCAARPRSASTGSTAARASARPTASTSPRPCTRAPTRSRCSCSARSAPTSTPSA